MITFDLNKISTNRGDTAEERAEKIWEYCTIDGMDHDPWVENLVKILGHYMMVDNTLVYDLYNRINSLKDLIDESYLAEPEF